tara:strand:+ start:2007 stop:3068 length:1062 start_codon:yes stop_codon:yes gene_type:complete
MLYDLIIVGQGIAGTVLYDHLKDKFKNILIISNTKFVDSTEVASGVYNPISLRRCVLSWKINQIMPISLSYYQKLQKKINKKIIFPLDIIKLFFNKSDLDMWKIKKNNTEVGTYIKDIYNRIEHKNLNKNLGGALISPAGYVDINLIRRFFLNKMKKKNIFLNEKFDHSKLKISRNKIQYKQIQAKKIVFCEGDRGSVNPFFKEKMFNPCKGEVITIKTSEKFFSRHILSKEVFVLPKEPNVFQIGSTYDRDYISRDKTVHAKDFLTKKLDKILNLDYKIISHKSSIRPTVIDRRPIIGSHKKHKNMYIFNGFGSKSVTLVPYFAKLFSYNLLINEPMITEVNPYRFNKKLTF